MDSKLDFKLYRHSKWGCLVDLNHLVDIEPYFSQRDISNKRNSGLYMVYNGNMLKTYTGQGKTVLDGIWKKIEDTCRAFNHKQNERDTELMVKYINSEYIIWVVAAGLTVFEARLLEAYFIRLDIKNGRTLSPIGATTWDGYSLWNKNKGICDKDFNKWSKLYLSDVCLRELYGDYTRLTT